MLPKSAKMQKCAPIFGCLPIKLHKSGKCHKTYVESEVDFLKGDTISANAKSSKNEKGNN